MKKIEKDRQLPGHTKLDYYECYAKIVLEEFFSYNNLLLDDKPDLQDIQNSIGIEVTTAEEPKMLEAENLYLKLIYADEDTIREKCINRMGQIGLTYKDGMLLGLSGNDDFTLVNEAINRKIEKLKSAGYKKFNEYQLFIFSSIYAIDSILQEELNFLLRENIDTFFSKIYILVPEALFYFDLGENECKIFNVSRERQYYQAQKARQIVEEVEKEE